MGNMPLKDNSAFPDEIRRVNDSRADYDRDFEAESFEAFIVNSSAQGYYSIFTF